MLMMPEPMPSHRVDFAGLDGWRVEASAWVREVDPAFEWDELVVSWNAEMPDGSTLTIDVRPEGAPRDYRLAVWSRNAAQPSSSVNGQKDEFARVDTDTLVLAQPGRRLQIRLAITGETPDLRLFTLAFRRRGTPWPTTEGNRSVWGTALEPPRRAQSNYPNGNVICSPTATSMVLGYWAQKLERPELDRQVPEVVAGVFDPGWNGTGNWSFNVAFAGALPGLRAYVDRLWSIEQLEHYIAAGMPVICSVSYALLKGEEKKRPNDGHLVVLVGFEANGDPIFNDPGRNVVRMTYKREDFDEAWANSGRTVYVIRPRHWVRAPQR